MEKRYDNLGIMVDCSRDGVMNIESLRRMIDCTSGMGYNMIQIYTEDTYEVDGQPYFGYKRGRYSAEELRNIDAYAASRGMELVPCIQTLAHFNAIFRWAPYRDINDCNDILLAECDKSYALLEDIFASVAKTFTSRRINIGMDEAHMLGLGQYLKKNGYSERFAILCRHLSKVIEIAKKHGFRPMLWSDMFFNLLDGGTNYNNEVTLSKEKAALLPKDIALIYWDYYHTDESHYTKVIKNHKLFGRELWFAGGAWCWGGFAPSSYFSLAASRAAAKSCLDGGIRNAFLTMWGDNGRECSPFAMLPVLFAFSEYMKGNFDDDAIAEMFAARYGYAFDEFTALTLPNVLTDEKVSFANPSKYMLYNDPFLGIFDSTCVEDGERRYENYASQLEATARKDGEYGYLFDSAAKLCRVLQVKYALGQKTRAAYESGDKVAIGALAEKEYTQAIERLQVFYEAFRALWEKDNKQYGFEIHDARLGGLIQRLKNCKRRLSEYAAGQSERIEELEEKVLPCESQDDKNQICYNVWSHIISAGIV